jgi:hypothetical protein
LIIFYMRGTLVSNRAVCWRMGEWENGGMGEWEDGKMGRWEDGRIQLKP